MTECPNCGYIFDAVQPFEDDDDTERLHFSDPGEGNRFVVTTHPDCGNFTTDLLIETQDEELYEKNKQMLLELISEIRKEEISPDLKTRMIDFLIDVSKNPTTAGLFLLYCSGHIH
jgi:hypothetical protein